MNDQELLRYSRHILLPEIDIEGQQAILDARVLVLGAGGLGSPAAMYLAAAGVGTIVLCDGDTVDLTNLQRQILHAEESVGMAKVLSGARTLERLNPHVKVEAVAARLEVRHSRRRSVAPILCWIAATTLQPAMRSIEPVFAIASPWCPVRRYASTATRGVRLAPDGQPLLSLPVSRRRRWDEVRCTLCGDGRVAPLTGIIGTSQAAEALKVDWRFRRSGGRPFDAA